MFGLLWRHCPSQLLFGSHPQKVLSLLASFLTFLFLLFNNWIIVNVGEHSLFFSNFTSYTYVSFPTYSLSSHHFPIIIPKFPHCLVSRLPWWTSIINIIHGCSWSPPSTTFTITSTHEYCIHRPFNYTLPTPHNDLDYHCSISSAFSRYPPCSRLTINP